MNVKLKATCPRCRAPITIRSGPIFGDTTPYMYYFDEHLHELRWLGDDGRLHEHQPKEPK